MASGFQLVAQHIKQLRQERAWPQEQLAEICDVSVRTVQRVENGQSCSYETLSALAAAFDLTPNDLTTSQDLPKEREITMTTATHSRNLSPAFEFKRHLAIYIAVNLMLIAINLSGDSDKMWFIYPLLGWGIGLISHWFRYRHLTNLPNAD